MKRRVPHQQKLADDGYLLRPWREWHREQRDAVLAGPHGIVLAALFRRRFDWRKLGGVAHAACRQHGRIPH